MVGELTFRNETNTAKTFDTGAFEKNVTDTVTTQVTSGFNSEGVSLSAPISLSSANGEFNFSQAEANTKTSQVPYNLDSQKIEVPARTEAKVKVLLERVKDTGKVELNAAFDNNSSFTLQYPNKPAGYLTTVGVVDYFANASSNYVLDGRLKLDQGKLNFNGSGEYSAEYSTGFSVGLEFFDLDTGAPKSVDGAKKSYSVPVKK
nr:ETX/MTX2 family pore-forming toxin [Marininema mesophilum]